MEIDLLNEDQTQKENIETLMQKCLLHLSGARLKSITDFAVNLKDSVKYSAT